MLNGKQTIAGKRFTLKLVSCIGRVRYADYAFLMHQKVVGEQG
jgi:hypothetical protein